MIVLGFRWLTQFNPSIDWVLCHIIFCPLLQPEAKTSPSVKTLLLAATPALPNPIPDPETPLPPVNRKPPRVTLINASAFTRTCKLKDTQCFQLRISAPETTGHSVATSPPADLSTLPEEYHNFLDVVSKSKAGKLADHQPYDLKITLDKGTIPSFSPIYSLSQEELAALWKFIDKNLATGFIHPSSSPCGAPVLFIRKKDGSLQLCINFQGLNQISKKDHYPLLLISELLDAP